MNQHVALNPAGQGVWRPCAEIILPDDQSVRVVVCPRPFSTKRIEYSFPPGSSLGEIVRTVEPNPRMRGYFSISFDGGERIEPKLWDHIRIKGGNTLTIRAVPQGGGNNKILRMVLMIAITALAAAATWYIGGIGGPIAGALVGAAIGIGGSILINALVPAASPRLRNLSSGNQSPTLAITGARNGVNIYGPVPRVYGRHRIVPPYGARPFTELLGKDQYLRLLFDLGYGPLVLSELKIGETPIDNFDEVEYEIRQGFIDDDPLTLYTRSVFEEQLSILIPHSTSSPVDDEEWQTRTTQPDADEISIDITFLQGLTQFRSNGTRIARSVHLVMEYSVAGADDWQPLSATVAIAEQTSAILTRPPPKVIPFAAGGTFTVHIVRTKRVSIHPVTGKVEVSGTTIPNTYLPIASVVVSSNPAVVRVMTDERPAILAGMFAPTLNGNGSVTVAAGTLEVPEFIVTDNSTTAVRSGQIWPVARGQYDVRIRRVTPDATDDKIFDQVTWTAIRTIRDTPPITEAGHCLVAIRIKATDELNGVVDEFNCIASSLLLDYDGTGWEERESANPAAVFLDILTGTANGWPVEDVEQIGITGLEEWAVNNIDTGREFNAIIDFETTVFDALRMVASCGRAAPTMRDGKFSVVRDTPQDTPVQHFTPRNSWGFRGTKGFPDLPHALRIPFVNRTNGWRADERVVYADGFSAENATRFETIDMFGVTDPEQIWKDGRYFQAVAVLRPETFELNCDFEHLVASQGDMVLVTHDVISVGIASGRITQVVTSDSPEVVTRIVVDELLTFMPGEDHGVSIRTVNNRRVTAQVENAVGSTKTLTFFTPIPFEGGFSPVSIGDLLGFGILGRETLECLVKTIQPGEELSAMLTLVPHSPEVHEAEDGPIPPFDPVVTALPRVPLPPVVVSVDSGNVALVLAKDGTVQSRIAVTLAAQAGLVPTVRFAAQFRPTNSDQFWSSVPDVSATGAAISIIPVQDGLTYDIRVRSLSPHGVPSDWVYINAHTVIGKTQPPPVPDSFTVSRLADGTRRYVWSLVDAPADVRAGGGYQIRYFLGSTTDWTVMTVLPPAFLVGFSHESNELSAGTYTFAIKTIDSSGNESETARFIDGVVLDDPNLRGVLLQSHEHERGWPGVKTDAFVDEGNVLRAVSVGGWADLPSTWDALASAWDDILPRESPIMYETEVFDVGVDLSFTPLISTSLAGIGVVEIKTGTDADGTVVGAYGAVGGVTERRFIQFRLSVSDASPTVPAAPAAFQFSILLDAEIVEVDLEDIDTAGADTLRFQSLGTGHFLISPDSISTITRAQITAFQNAGSGWTWELISKNASLSPMTIAAPAAEFKTYQNGTPAEATIDVNIKGVA